MEEKILVQKIGILTFHYSNNYGGILQAQALQKAIEALGYDAQIINYVPSSYKPYNIKGNLNIKKNIFKNKVHDLNIITLLKKIWIMKNYSKAITKKFDNYREKNMNLSVKVDETTLEGILTNYYAIIVGSDQVWNPSQRKNPIYFLNFGDKYSGKKISYAPDSTIKELDTNDDINILKSALGEFHHISVRNQHSLDFVKTVVNRSVEIVADPTLLLDFDCSYNKKNQFVNKDYILMYVLGKEIDGSHIKAIEKIRNKYGNIPVYSIKIPTMNFELSPFADKVFYDLNPSEWLCMFKNAKFIYTDSFHGVLFSLKYHKPFLAYYSEKLRATRFIDLGNRYDIKKYIVQNTTEIDTNELLDVLPDFKSISKAIDLQKQCSIEFLKYSIEQ